MPTTNLRDILSMLAAVATFSVMDVIMKRLVEVYPAMQVTFLRGAASLPFLLGAATFFNHWGNLVPRRWSLHLARGVLSVATLWFFVYAVGQLSLANTYTIFMSAPLDTLAQLPAHLAAVRSRGIEARVLYLEAKTDTLVKRFSETRRRHPLARGRMTLPECIERERELLAPVVDLAHHVDTSDLRPNALRGWVRDFIGLEGSGLTLLFESFGFKHGIPLDADLVFDVRCLPNPYDPELRPLTGRDARVIEFLDATPEAQRMLDDIRGFVERWLPAFIRDNRSYLTVALGCTGGRHSARCTSPRPWRSTSSASARCCCATASSPASPDERDARSRPLSARHGALPGRTSSAQGLAPLPCEKIILRWPGPFGSGFLSPQPPGADRIGPVRRGVKSQHWAKESWSFLFLGPCSITHERRALIALVSAHFWMHVCNHAETARQHPRGLTTQLTQASEAR